MPWWLAAPASLIAVAHAIGLVWRYRAMPDCMLLFPGNPDAPVLKDGEALAAARLEWRGPLAFLHWRTPQGKARHLVWWPDTLPPARRRELRLAAPAGKSSRWRQGMAP